MKRVMTHADFMALPDRDRWELDSVIRTNPAPALYTVVSVEKICPTCGDNFDPIPGSGAVNTTYCSPECRPSSRPKSLR